MSTDWAGLDTHNRFPDPLDGRFGALVCFGLGGVLTYRDVIASAFLLLQSLAQIHIPTLLNK